MVVGIKSNKDDLVQEIKRFIKNNSRTPRKCDIKTTNGYISSYQFEKFFNTRKWNTILDELGFDGSNKSWTDAEITYLKNNWCRYSDSEIASHLNRSARSVSFKRNELKLFRQPQKNMWKQWEIRYLKNNFYDTSREEIESNIPHRKWETIRAYATKVLKLNRQHSLYKYVLGNGKRVCKGCREILEENSDNFYIDKNNTFRIYCKLCWSDIYYRNTYGHNYQEILSEKYKDLYDDKGDKCDSIAEKIITNWLIRNNIEYIKQPYYRDYIQSDKTWRRFDWIIKAKDKQYFVEYFGIWDMGNISNNYVSTYVDKAKRKIKLLYKEGLTNNCVFIFPNDLKYGSINNIFADILS